MKIADLNALGHGFRDRGPPEAGTDPGQQLVHAEWLGDKVIGAGIQSFDFVLFLASDRQHDDGHIRHHADPPAKFDPVQIRHCQIGNDEVGRPVLHDLQRHLAIIGDADIVSPGGQGGAEHAGDLGFIVHHKNVGMLHVISPPG